MAGIKQEKNVTKKEILRPNGFRTAKLLTSVALAGAIAACGSKDEQPPSLGNGDTSSAGAAGVAGAAGSAANVQGTGGSGASTSVGGGAGAAGAAGATTGCPITADYDLSCDSLASVPKTMEVGEEVKLGLDNGAVVVRLTGITGADFETAQWEASNTACDSYSMSVNEGESADLWVATNVVNVRVAEISPDSQNLSRLVNVTFSAVCEETPATGGSGGAAGASGGSGTAGAAGATAGAAGATETGGTSGGAGVETGGAGGAAGAAGTANTGGVVETGGSGGTVPTQCEVSDASLGGVVIRSGEELELGGLVFSYGGQYSNGIVMEIKCAGSETGTSYEFPIYMETSVEFEGSTVSIVPHVKSDTVANVTIRVSAE